MADHSLDPILASIIGTHAAKGSTVVVGVAGGVAAGKSTFSASVAESIRNDTGLEVAIVASDGFLFANSVLAERALSDRKGFPESYDSSAIDHFLSTVRTSRPAEVPVYDHHIYDVVEATRIIPVVDIVFFEGVNALRFDHQIDFGIYLHAEEPLLRRWFVARTTALREAARVDYSPFFDPWLDVPEASFQAMVDTAWETVNLPNLVDHIEPTKSLAHAVIEWDADHSVRAITFTEHQ